MTAAFKYAFVLALGTATGSYLHSAVGFEDLFKLGWRDGTELVINRVFAPGPKAAAALVDPAVAAALDEDLDYRISQRKASVEGWRAFLAAHADGPHAAFAKAAIERLGSGAEAPTAAVEQTAQSAPASYDVEASAPAAEAMDRASQDAAHPAPSASQPEAVDAPMSPASTAAGKDVASLAPAQSLAEPSSAASANPSEASGLRPSTAPRPARHPAKKRAADATPLPPPRPVHDCAFRSDCLRKALPLPPILLALLNSRPKHATGSARTIGDARAIGAPSR